MHSVIHSLCIHQHLIERHVGSPATSCRVGGGRELTVGRFLVGAQEGENRRRKNALIVVGRDWAGKGAGEVGRTKET